MADPPAQPTPLILELGGEAVIRRLVDVFYDWMDALAEAAPIRRMHKPDLTEAREHLFLFLVFWSGGRSEYIERRGHPRLRMRHMPFAVDDSAAQQWMLCMDGALDEVIEDEALRSRLSRQFTRIAAHMRNRAS